MKVVRFDKQRRLPKQRDVLTPTLAIVALVAVCALGWVIVDRFIPSSTSSLRNQPIASAPQSDAVTASLSMCGSNRYTCVVDGDTIWFKGQNLRLQSYGTPEPYNGVCGGQAEVTLARRASARLLQLLNSNAFTVETFGLDNTGSRTLATVRIDGRDVGDILIDERLARRWPDGEEWWCS